MNTLEPKKLPILTIIWKSFVALLAASLTAGVCISSAAFIIEAGNASITIGEVFTGIIGMSFMVMVFTVIPVVLLEIVGRHFKWKRGVFEPIAGVILGPGLVFSIYLLSGSSGGERSNMAIIMIIFAIAGAVGGFVYHTINKKLGNS